MSEDEKSREPLTLRRWSARKHAIAREQTAAVVPNVSATAFSPSATAPLAQAEASQPIADATPELPPVESLTFDSDFTAFLKPNVDEALKRKALKKLLHDPRFNVMDGLDTYIADYSKPDPIEPEVVKQLMQARYLFNPPKTRVTEQGFVEDVPPESENEEKAVQGDVPPQAIADNAVPRDGVPLEIADEPEPSKPE
jgi:Protein of unknown function (DUF3306)